jgi:hypothetical protein
MPIDNLDNKIREAASHLEPAYNEKAWEKMEKLLDEHLPQTKRRDRKLFWIFFILFLAAGSFILFNQTGKKRDTLNKENTSQKSNVNRNENAISSKHLSKNKTTTQIDSSKINRQVIKISKSNSFKNNNTKSIAANNRAIDNNNTREKFKKDNGFTAVTITPDPGDKMQENSKAEENDNLIKDPTVNAQKTPEMHNLPVAPQVSETDSMGTNRKDTLVVKESPVKFENTSDKKNKFSNSFFIAFSAGPDVSAVTIDEIGKINFSYGVGIGYSFAKKWDVRTGFYIEKKVYNAKPSSYDPPERFWYNFPDLKSIEANCKVYAVPVIVDYNFSENSKSLWFGGVGLASYFMKKEVYDYNSKSPSGQSSYSTYSIKDKNKHYFSIVRFSAGYEKKLSDHISFITEPYIAVPLAGVGYGKVKLYSSGVLLTLKVKPFSKK